MKNDYLYSRHSRAGGTPVTLFSMPLIFVRYAELFFSGFPSARE